MVHFFFAATFGVALSGLPLVAADDCLANGGTFFKEAELKKSKFLLYGGFSYQYPSLHQVSHIQSLSDNFLHI